MRSNQVLVRSDHRSGEVTGRSLARRARGFLLRLGLSGCELSLVVTSDRRIRRLNREWRGKDQPTDVLSFPAGSGPGPWRVLGDVVVSLDTAKRVSRKLGRPLGEELARYLAHGLLHLLGHDHLRARDARRMARVEARLLDREGMVPRR